MPEQNLTDAQIAYRQRVAAGARILEGSERVMDLIAAGPQANVQRVAFRAQQLREDVQQLAGYHPDLKLVADSLAPVEQRLREYAAAVA